MKIELNHKEIGDAISLYLKSKLMDGTTFAVNVDACTSAALCRDSDKPRQWSITATCTPVGEVRPVASDKAA